MIIKIGLTMSDVVFNAVSLTVTIRLAHVGPKDTGEMFLPYIFNVLFFMSSTHGFIYNSFRYLTKEISSSMKLKGINTDETCWLEQKLDHFDKNDKRTWAMRFFRRHDFWKQTGPIYVFLGGESEGSPDFLKSGIAYELARETNGALYSTEHRYYGESIPLNGTEVRNLKYLSARQALADNAHLIRTIKKNPKFQNSKVVVVGGSYSGNLATWMRLLYPDLVDAAIASSAPVLAKKDFYEYLEKVSDDFKQYGPQECWRTINDRFKYYESMFKTQDGIEKLKKDENICPGVDMSIPENRQLFFFYKVSPLMQTVQYGDTTEIIRQCRIFNKAKKYSLDTDFSLLSEQEQCYNFDFNVFVDYYFKNQINDMVLWTYQTCNEFGYFQSSSSNRQPFTNNIPVNYFVKICTKAYGPDFTDSRINRGIDSVNKMFGGLKPNVTNVVFVNGDLDPWSRLSILHDLSDNAPAIVIPRASHCRDLFSDKDSDEKELKDARRNIKNYVKKWIGFQ